MPGKTNKVRVYSRATEDVPGYRVMSGVMEVSVSAFYARAKKPGDTDKIRKREVLETRARQLFDEHKQTYGYRRLSDALSKAGMKSGHYQVRHLMARRG